MAVYINTPPLFSRCRDIWSWGSLQTQISCHWKLQKTFWRALKSPSPLCETLLLKSPVEVERGVWAWFLKNDHLLTFARIESDLSVVRPPRLLWKIDMIMRKAANTNFMSWETTENFLEGSEVAVATFCTPQTLLLPLVTSKREFHKVATATSKPSKKFSVASHDMKFVFASFLMIISISQSKRGGRTTLRSDSIGAKVSKW